MKLMQLHSPRKQALERAAQHASGWLGRASGTLLAGLLAGWAWSPVGLGAGYLLDRRRLLAPYREASWEVDFADPVQRQFVIAACAFLGHVAKADGRVSRAEIDLAGRIFDRMELAGESRQRAIRLFGAGKRANFPSATMLRRLHGRIRVDPAMPVRFLEYQVAMAHADGPPHPGSQRLLRRLSSRLGQPERLLDDLLRQARWPGGLPLRPVPCSPYRLLGVAESASDEEVRRAYRRLVSQHHPDRLQARGLDAEAVRAGTTRVIAAKQAFESIRKERASRR